MCEREYWTNETLKDRWHVSDEALQRFRDDPDDPLPHLRAGRRYLYIPEEVEEWARRQAKKRRGALADER